MIALVGAPPELRGAATSTSSSTRDRIGTIAFAAMAVADVDGDGDLDLVGGAGGTLTVLANDGGGGFSVVPGAVEIPPAR